MKRRLLQISVGVLAGITISMLVLYPSTRDERLRLQEEEMGFLPYPLETPDFALISQGGESFSSDDLLGRVSFVFFGFSNCPDVCPVTLMNLTRALEMIPDGSTRVQGVMISVDPQRDTPERLTDYMAAFDPTFVALTGDVNDIRAAASGFGVFFANGADPDSLDAVDAPDASGETAAANGVVGATESGGGEDGQAGEDPHGGHVGPGMVEAADAAGRMTTVEVGGYVVEHTARSYVLDEEGRIVLTFPPFANAEQIATGLAHLLDR